MAKKRIFNLIVKGKYFHEIKAKTKKFEYREIKPYWDVRILNHEFDEIIIKLGMPKAGDFTNIIRRPWCGYVIKRGLIHEFWDNKPLDVYAIRVND